MPSGSSVSSQGQRCSNEKTLLPFCVTARLRGSVAFWLDNGLGHRRKLLIETNRKITF
jgi:hypothetical protein